MAFQDSSAPVLTGTDTMQSPLGPEITDSGVVLQRRGADIASNPAGQVGAPQAPNAGVPAAAGLTMGGPSPLGSQVQAPAQPNPRPWAGILQGALWGLAGASQKGPGRGGFGAGVGMGAAAAQQMKFASVKAADDHIRAQKEQELLDIQTDESKLNLQLQYQNIAALNKLFHLTPDGSFSAQTTQDMHNKAVGALQTAAAASPDGTLGRVQTVGSPAGNGQKEHIVDYTYPPTLQDFQQNEKGMQDFVSEAFKADGKVLTPQWWETGGGKVTVGEKPNAIGMLNQQQIGQSEMFMDAQKRLYSPFGGKEIITTGARTPDQITSMNAGTSESLHQQADAYDKLPDANPTVSKLLHGQATNFDNAVDGERVRATKGKIADIAATAPAEAAAAAQKTSAEEAAKFDPTTTAGLLNIQTKQQDLVDKKFSNADKRQKSLFENGVDPEDPTKTLNLSTPGAGEMLVDQHTGQPIPTKNVAAIKPSQQEINRADFAKSVLHILDVVDKQRAAGNVPNGPIKGWSAKQLASVGLGDEKSQQAINEIALAVSAATGAHVGGRFNQEIMEKMNTLINLNMNDSQLTGAEESVRAVMTPYATNGGRMSVADYKHELLTTPQYRKGVLGQVTGFDNNGRPLWVPVTTGK